MSKSKIAAPKAASTDASKEQLRSMIGASPLAGAVAMALALPNGAVAGGVETFKISSQQDLDNAIAAIQAESDSGVFNDSEGASTRKITFSSSLSGSVLDFPDLDVRDWYYYPGSTTTVEIDGAGASDLTLRLAAEAEGYSSVIGMRGDVHLMISDVNLSIEREASEYPSAANYGYGEGIGVEYGQLTLEGVHAQHKGDNGEVLGVSTYGAEVAILNSRFTGATGERTAYFYDGEGEGMVKKGAGVYLSETVPQLSSALYISSPYAESSDLGVTISNSVFENFQHTSEWSGAVTIEDLDGEGALISGTTFQNNSSGSVLNLPYSYGGTVVVDGSTFHGNSTMGGAINQVKRYSWQTGLSGLVVTNSSFYNNEVGAENAYGESSSQNNADAVIRMDGVDQSVLFNVTIAKNQGGAALGQRSYSNDLVATHITVVGNNTGGRSAVDLQNGGGVVNSIVTNNGGDEVYNADVYYSIIGTDLYGDGSIDETGINPLLGPVVSTANGRVALLKEDSPAVDGGRQSFNDDIINNYVPSEALDYLNLTIDQTGFSRIVGDHPDMGAYEWRKGKEGSAPSNPSASSSKVFGSMGMGFLGGIFSLLMLRRRQK